MSKTKNKPAATTVVTENIPAPALVGKGSPRGGTIKGWQKLVREHPEWTEEQAIEAVNADAVKQGFTYVLTAEKLKEWKDKPTSNGGKNYGSGEPTPDDLMKVRLFGQQYDGGLTQLAQDVADYANFEARFAKLLNYAEEVGGMTRLDKAVKFWAAASSN